MFANCTKGKNCSCVSSYLNFEKCKKCWITVEFFTKTQSWQSWPYCQLFIPIYLQFSSLFSLTYISKCEIGNQVVLYRGLHFKVTHFIRLVDF